MKEEGGGEEKEKEETKRNKEIKGEEDKNQASGVGEVGGPERWGTKEVRQEVGHMGGGPPHLPWCLGPRGLLQDGFCGEKRV